MKYWLQTIRYWILTGNIVLSAIIFLGWFTILPSSNLQLVRLNETYAILSLVFLFFTLLCGPLYTVFPFLPGRALYTRARRALGVSAFYYATLHAIIIFFTLLGGFQGLSFFSGRYMLDFILATTALAILSLMALTSFDYFVFRMGKWWYALHRLVYIAGLIIIVHAFTVGAHYVDTNSLLAFMTLSGTFIIVLLHCLVKDKKMKLQYPSWPKYGITTTFIVVILAVILLNSLFTIPLLKSLSVHTHA